MSRRIPDIGKLFIPPEKEIRAWWKWALFLFFALLVILGAFGVYPF